MRIIIIGCGRMGAGLSQTLAQRGHDIAVIDRDPTTFAALGPAFPGQTITGIGFDRDVLAQAAIERADGLAAVTSSDEANLVVARVARRMFYVPKVVARLYDPRKAEIYRRLDVQTISTTGWGIQQIADLLCHSPLDAIASLGDAGVDLLELAVPPLLVNRTTNAITIPGEVHVVAINRAGTVFLCTPDTILRDNDLLYLAVLPASIERLRALLEI